MGDKHNQMKEVLESPQLPTLPAVALQIIEQIQQDEVSIDSIAETISLDPALSSKILKTVNSSFYGQAKTISSIHQAVIVLGLNSVKTLALGFSLVNNLAGPDVDEPELIGLWRRSLYSATAAKRICELTNIVQMEEMFLAGLLQDVGILALRQVLGQEYEAVYKKADGNHQALLEYEREALGCDHAEIGAALAEKWGLPPLLAVPIRFHENPDDGPEEIRPLVRVVNVGAIAAELMIQPECERCGVAYLGRMQDWFSIGPDKAQELICSFLDQSREMQKLFEVPAGDLGRTDQILSRASELLERLAIDAAQETARLEQDNDDLKKQAYTDSMTGVANRRAFNEAVSEQFIEAQSSRPLTVMFLDIDHFKQVNDERGHGVGDAALAWFAKTVAEAVGEHGTVYRHGGEEFAVLCPAVDRRVAAGMAERVRLAIEEGICQTEEGDALKLTTSIGVSTYDGAMYRRPDQLVQAADSSVYAAKSAGRNCVRVFTPRGSDNAAA